MNQNEFKNLISIDGVFDIKAIKRIMLLHSCPGQVIYLPLQIHFRHFFALIKEYIACDYEAIIHKGKPHVLTRLRMFRAYSFAK